VNLVLHIWRQKAPGAKGGFTRYEVRGITPQMSFLEMLDVLNDRLTSEDNSPVAFESDCREGICGTCGFMINGIAHGPIAGTAVCQVRMRYFTDGMELTLEPWRARAFTVLKDLVADRSAFDRIIAAGGFIVAPTGAATEANAASVPQQNAEAAIDAAACIGCGACVAACPNTSAALFTGAKIAHLGLLPQGQPERDRRAVGMVEQMDAESFGNCSWHGECQEACPKRISIDVIARMNRDYLRAATTRPLGGGDAP
jgi:succinate dehydrogenase / fumarate reductase iron-sulfur subunit